MKIYRVSKFLAEASDDLEYIGEVKPPIGSGSYDFAEYWRVETAYADFFINLLQKMEIFNLTVSYAKKGYGWLQYPYSHEKGSYKYRSLRKGNEVRLDCFDNILRSMLRVECWVRLFHDDKFFMQNNHDMFIHFGIATGFEDYVSKIELSPLIGIQDITALALEDPEDYYFGMQRGKG